CQGKDISHSQGTPKHTHNDLPASYSGYHKDQYSYQRHKCGGFSDRTRNEAHKHIPKSKNSSLRSSKSRNYILSTVSDICFSSNAQWSSPRKSISILRISQVIPYIS